MATQRRSIQRTPHSRVWTIENRAGPANSPAYQGLARAGGYTYPQGDITPVRIPSEDAYDQFDIVDLIQGQRGLPSIDVMFRATRNASEVLRLARKRCPLDLQIHIGACKNPGEFNAGWEKILVVEQAYPTSASSDDLGAFDGDQNAPVTETLPLTGMEMYEILPVNGTLQAESEVTDEVIDVVICDAATCGECGIASDGCQVMFAVVRGSTGSPGLPTEVLYTQNGGQTWARTNVDSMAISEQASAAACVGPYLVIVSNNGDSIHYAEIADILLGTETWTEVTTGIVAAGSPNDLFSLRQSLTWIVGDGGYVYFSDGIESGVEVQTSGDVTTEVLNAIHGFDEESLIAGGANNVILLTRNGGGVWTLVTGPEAGVAVNTVWMRGEDEWIVGMNNGTLYFTTNAGVSWTQIAFPGSGSGVVRDIVFPTPTVGYLAHSTSAPAGRILRSVDGGASWYVLPEETGALPVTDYIGSLAACAENVNVALGGGLAANGTDGALMLVG